MKIKIVDSPCGYGKTSWAIQFMNEEMFERFIYITPFLPEVERVINGCYNREFVQPNVKRGKGSKRKDFENLVTKGKNICSTHSLFKGLNKEIKDKIKDMEYILILDEVMDIVEQLKITKDDINMLITNEIISIEDKKVYWKDESYIGEFLQYKDMIKNGDVYLHNNVMILWTFPCEIFESFKEIYIMTYLFDGQIQRYYYQLNEISYEYKSVTKNEDRYELIEYEDIRGNKFKDLIHIYEGKINNIGNGNFALSSTWYKKASKKELIEKLKRNTSNYYKNICKAKAEECMWTTFLDYKHECRGKGYTKGFVDVTARATNEFKDRNKCAYLCNRFYNPLLKQFFIDKGITINEDEWALSELIQWLFRSAIRQKEDIELYIPSERMRKLLIEWLNN